MIPKLETPVYELTLPSNGKKIKYRPFVVKERTILLLALQEGTAEATLTALTNLFKVCTFDVCNLHDMPIVDSEYLFIHLRNKSIGEDLDILHECECGAENEVRMSMEKVEIEGAGGIVLSKDIDLGNGLWLRMKFPTLSDSTILSETPTEEEVLTVIASCIDSIIQNDSVFKSEDSTLEELQEFIESLTQLQLNKVETFFSSIPKVVIKGGYTCSKCGKENSIRLEGLENFFG